MQCRCRLSKRQRTLYEDYMASSDTSATLASSNFLGIINVLMQLRKVTLVDLYPDQNRVSSHGSGLTTADSLLQCVHGDHSDQLMASVQ